MRDKRRSREEDIEDLVARFDAGESAWDEDDEVIEIEVKKPLDKVIPVRLTSAHWDALYREARELGIGPTTLARMWILEKLRSLPARAPVPSARPPAARKPAPKGRRAARNSVTQTPRAS
ncbi:MAG: hypothetical protein ACYDEB_11750 [Dehalococcoidia bacterium]